MTDERNNSPEAQTQAMENEEQEAHTESADIEQLQQQLSEALDKSNEYLEGWQRARAEFANYKKRMDREQELAYQTASGTILKKFLEVIDDLELALKNRPTQGEGAEWATGIEMIYRKLISLLEGQGIQRMNAEGQMFDPNLHEAVTSEPSSDHESGQIIEVLRAGYLLGDRVLRPAMVRVAQ